MSQPLCCAVHRINSLEYIISESRNLGNEVEAQNKLPTLQCKGKSTWDTVPKAFLAVLVILWRAWHFPLASVLSQVGVSWKFSSTCFNGIRFLRDIRMVLRELKEALLLNLSGTGLSFSSKSARSWCFRQPIVALTFLSIDTILFQFLVNLFLKQSE